MFYRAHVSPRTLTTTPDPLRQYPQSWELLRWYRCGRKYPYPSDLIAALMADERSDEYAHYPCPLDPTHWHVGRGHNDADPKYLLQRAKRVYRKSVRDEIWRDYVVRQEEQDARAAGTPDA